MLYRIICTAHIQDDLDPITCCYEVLCRIICTVQIQDNLVDPITCWCEMLGRIISTIQIQPTGNIKDLVHALCLISSMFM